VVDRCRTCEGEHRAGEPERVGREVLEKQDLDPVGAEELLVAKREPIALQYRRSNTGKRSRLGGSRYVDSDPDPLLRTYSLYSLG